MAWPSRDQSNGQPSDTHPRRPADQPTNPGEIEGNRTQPPPPFKNRKNELDYFDCLESDGTPFRSMQLELNAVINDFGSRLNANAGHVSPPITKKAKGQKQRREIHSQCQQRIICIIWPLPPILMKERRDPVSCPLARAGAAPAPRPIAADHLSDSGGPSLRQRRADSGGPTAVRHVGNGSHSGRQVKGAAMDRGGHFAYSAGDNR